VAEHRELAGGNALAAIYSWCSTARLYQAAVRAASELEFVINASDEPTMTLSFRAAGPTPTWPGHEMTAVVHPHAAGAQIVVGSARYSGQVLQMAAWHQAKQLALMFLDRLTAVLPAVPEPAAAVQTPPSRTDRLESLVDLRDRGLLTDDEFETEKNRLLAEG
jgi:hypothetical protein